MPSRQDVNIGAPEPSGMTNGVTKSFQPLAPRNSASVRRTFRSVKLPSSSAYVNDEPLVFLRVIVIYAKLIRAVPAAFEGIVRVKVPAVIVCEPKV